VILAVSVICAETEERAEHLALTGQLSFVRVRRGEFAPLPSPEEALAYDYTPEDRSIAAAWRQLVYIGTPDSVRKRIEDTAASASADEVMVMTLVHDHASRIRSYELLITA
jgi:alkanesulfonate monooxygenase SsuD/methylene tetrahydromethanopterin reductase-like flavin-dependent oxidoreductase (luciferase family)